MIGSAASAVQFVPEIAPRVDELVLFQRTPNWVLPKADTPYTPEQLERLRTDPDALLTARREVWDRVDGSITFSNPDAIVQAQTAGAPEHVGRRGPRGPRQAHADLPARVQAPARLERRGTPRSTAPTSSSSPR